MGIVTPDKPRIHIVMLAYPKLTQLDLTGPYEVLARFPELKISLVWKTVDPIDDALGLRLIPTTTFTGCAPADILFVPGGPGQLALMEDSETLTFLRAQADGATWITSVCTGSLILAAAGLLTGYRATCHWLSLDQLGLFGVSPVAERVVRDRNRLTGAGVTSGIDFALILAAELFGEDRVREVLLAMEYDPAPPFSGGSIKTADPEVVERVRRSSAHFQLKREAAAARAAQALSDLQASRTGHPYDNALG
jgi:cyclohexyl-isocyanide hydratase